MRRLPKIAPMPQEMKDAEMWCRAYLTYIRSGMCVIPENGFIEPHMIADDYVKRYKERFGGKEE